ncbi:hypothetical protein [Corynebacterium macginleyi]|uniref:hypothetical protein n=1 Tax=Corynebacterium macginleyi TaxID=38290 RepID=UPI00190D4413|nr:hypothetical protein [Corynebacterium macginleyi]MBK4146406.1 hypothetical protein [Corynebacterium macginleyi]
MPRGNDAITINRSLLRRHFQARNLALRRDILHHLHLGFLHRRHCLTTLDLIVEYPA